MLLSGLIFAQENDLKLKINSIVDKDSIQKERIYTINYQIENLTNKPVSFFLKPNTLIANAASSMTIFPIYKLYINNEATNFDGPFFEKDGIDWKQKLKAIKDYSSPEAKEIIQKAFAEIDASNKTIVDNYKKNGGTITDDKIILESNKWLTSKITLQPNETKQFTIETYWDKERYTKQDDLEYYLNENDTYEFELILSLQKDNLRMKIVSEEFEKITKDVTFIQGNFISNKVAINFK